MRLGWVKIHRKIQDHPLWVNGGKFDKRSAFIDLIMMANYEDREVPTERGVLMVHRGQTFTSIQKLSERWKWGRATVVRFLGLLVSTGMIQRSSTHNGTLLTIENYGFYQGEDDTVRNADDTQSGTEAELKRVRTRYTKKEDNKLRSKKENIGAGAQPVFSDDGAGNQWQ